MKSSIIVLALLSACGSVDKLATDADTKLNASGTGTSTGTVISTTTEKETKIPEKQSKNPDVEVNVNVTVENNSVNNQPEYSACEGPVKMYLVLNRETSGWPWHVVSQSEYKADANHIAHGLIEQGYFPDNVDVITEHEDGCKDGLTGEISPY